jgi:NADH dehydrogenase
MAAIGPVLPLIGGGETRLQPVFVGDVAAAVAAVLIDPNAAGRTYELGGPTVYSFKALMALVARETGRRPLLAPVPFGLAGLLGAGGDLVNALGLPIDPPLTSDQVLQLKTDNVVQPGALTLADLGVTPTALEAILPRYLFRYRKGGQYAEQLAAEKAG